LRPGNASPLRQLFTASRLKPISLATPAALARIRRLNGANRVAKVGGMGR
jgi:hypothetical protein